MINSKELTFGRNETFLRYGWIAKGLSAYQQDPKIFNEVDAPLKLGVGKNMVSSIKYWLKALRHNLCRRRDHRVWYENF